MSDNNRTQQPITKEMLIDKIDAEYEAVNQERPDGIDPDLLSYRLEAMSYLRDALYALPVSDDLLSKIYYRENVMNEVYLFWVDEASKGETVVDKIDLAYTCAKAWLADVRTEHRKSLLDDRITAEHTAFIEEELKKYPEKILDDAWKITCFNDLLMALKEEDLPAQDVDALLTLEFPLHSIYDEYLSKDMSDHMSDLVDTALDIASLQHDSLINGHIPENSQTKAFIDEYMSLYGTDCENGTENSEQESEQQYGIDPLQSERFTEIALDEGLDFDEELDEGLEI